MTSDPVGYVLSKQNRRDLTPSQRAMIGARATALTEKLTAEARVRQREAVSRANRSRHAPVVEPAPQLAGDSVKTRD